MNNNIVSLLTEFYEKRFLVCVDFSCKCTKNKLDTIIRGLNDFVYF